MYYFRETMNIMPETQDNQMTFMLNLLSVKGIASVCNPVTPLTVLPAFKAVIIVTPNQRCRQWCCSPPGHIHMVGVVPREALHTY